MFESIAYAQSAQGPGTSGNPIAMFFPFVLMFVMMWFLILRPQKKHRQQLQKLVENLKKGDRITTQGGILGTISSLQDDYVVMITGDNSSAKMEVLKSAITGLRQEGKKSG